jgi:hypothetical protein
MKRLRPDQQELDPVAGPSVESDGPAWCHGLHVIPLDSFRRFLEFTRPAFGAACLPLQLGYTHNAVRRKALARLLAFQSSRAICAARMMQVSLGAKPQRSERSQSPQVNSDVRRIAAIWRETAPAMLRKALVTDIGSSFAKEGPPPLKNYRPQHALDLDPDQIRGPQCQEDPSRPATVAVAAKPVRSEAKSEGLPVKAPPSRETGRSVIN